MAEPASKRPKISASSPQPFQVGLLGATGIVGQRFIEQLAGHPYFELSVVAASARSAGKTFQEAASWRLQSEMPHSVRNMQVYTCEPAHFQTCSVIFSALDSSVAGPIETAFAEAGFPVFSNAKNHRMDADVPILIPYVNSDHIDIVKSQRWYKSSGGFIVTNANCSTTGLVIALKPILDTFGIEKLIVFTMQAISGAGYPGVASLDIVDNVVPFISGEEPKLETEPLKILGDVKGSRFEPANFVISAHCNRVNCLDGHTECASIKLRRSATTADVESALRQYTSPAQELKLPSAAPQPVIVRSEGNRPQPRLDRDLHRGYSVTVGRVRPCPLFDVRLVLCSHNTIIGAAGGSILNAELAVAKGLLVRPA